MTEEDQTDSEHAKYLKSHAAFAGLRVRARLEKIADRLLTLSNEVERLTEAINDTNRWFGL